MKKYCKVKEAKMNFDQGGVEAIYVSDSFPYSTYQHIEPQLFELMERSSSVQ